MGKSLGMGKSHGVVKRCSEFGLLQIVLKVPKNMSLIDLVVPPVSGIRRVSGRDCIRPDCILQTTVTCNKLIDWLADWLTDWLTDWLNDWLIDGLRGLITLSKNKTHLSSACRRTNDRGSPVCIAQRNRIWSRTVSLPVSHTVSQSVSRWSQSVICRSASQSV